MKADSTRDFYEVFAQEYFQATSNVTPYSMWDKLTNRLKPCARILDLGCGSGRDLLFFSEMGYQIVGLDYSFNLLRLAKRFSRQPVIQADFQALPFGNNVFDAAWAIGSLLHIPPRSINSALQQIRNVLKQGALFLTSVKEGNGEHIDSMGRYNTFYQDTEWHRILEKHGFELIESETMVEHRRTPPGSNVDIRWIVSLSMTCREY